MVNTEPSYPEIEYTPEQKRALGQVYRLLIACARRQPEISTPDVCATQKMDNPLGDNDFNSSNPVKKNIAI